MVVDDRWVGCGVKGYDVSWYDEDGDEPDCQVVINQEMQYAFWPADRPPPDGWTETGTCGTPRECAQYVREVWTDMRPLSLRLAMGEGGDVNVGTGDVG
jgi:MbtH protein